MPSGILLGRGQRSSTVKQASISSIEDILSDTSAKGDFDSLAALAANATESYSAVILLLDQETEVLSIVGSHSLSRDFLEETKFSLGSSFVGWVAQHLKPVLVCPFERDATILRYYSADQALKSFIALPIIRDDGQLVGVLACDSKKRYAFSKIDEKILSDCCRQVVAVLNLHSKLDNLAGTVLRQPAGCTPSFLEAIRNEQDEAGLLNLVAELPQNLVPHDALIVVSTSECGVGSGSFYSATGVEHLEHRLFELVSRHKKVLCAERSVHVLPTNDVTQRAFLSVPIRVLDNEAGSLNLLSRPYRSFEPGQVKALEQVASEVGRSLELIRLRERYSYSAEMSKVLTPRLFEVKLKAALEDAKIRGQSLSLARIELSNILELESAFGFSIASRASKELVRVFDQATPSRTIISQGCRDQILVFIPGQDLEKQLKRVMTILSRTPLELSAENRLYPGVPLSAMLIKGLRYSVVTYPDDGHAVSSLIEKALMGLSRSDVYPQNESKSKLRRTA